MYIILVLEPLDTSPMYIDDDDIADWYTYLENKNIKKN
jgi:hypothetical protein